MFRVVVSHVHFGRRDLFNYSNFNFFYNDD